MVKRPLVGAGDVDEVLGGRVASELERHGWSYGELVRRMADHGCAISKAALHRVVNGNPGGGRRGLSARELVALAAVLDVDIDDLLTPLELLDRQRAQELIRERDEADGALWHAAGRLYAVINELNQLHAQEPELSEYVDNRMRAADGNGLPAVIRLVQRSAGLPDKVALALSQTILAMSGIHVVRPTRSSDSTDEETS